MTRTVPPPPSKQHVGIPIWVRQIAWFVALWCLGISALGFCAFVIRAALPY